VLGAIGPRIVVPMHYKIEGKINLPIRHVSHFLAAMVGWPIEHAAGSWYEITPATLPERPTIVVLDPDR
jgi:hypothetical protein